jgi:hypothetical protein
MSMQNLLRLTGRSLNNNSPIILSGLAVAGVVATAILAVKATPKAVEEIEVAETRKNTRDKPELVDGEAFGDGPYTELTPVEIVQTTWKLYLPAAVIGAATIACIVGSNTIGMRRNAALLGAYTLVDTAFREYKSEVVEQIGAIKERKVTDELAKRKVEQHPVSDAQVIITGGGDQLCMEALTGRYFQSDIEKIRQAQNEFNREILLNAQYSSLNEWFELLGLRQTTVGGILGFDVEHLLELSFASTVADDGRTALVVDYVRLPTKDFGKF